MLKQSLGLFLCWFVLWGEFLSITGWYCREIFPSMLELYMQGDFSPVLVCMCGRSFLLCRFVRAGEFFSFTDLYCGENYPPVYVWTCCVLTQKSKRTTTTTIPWQESTKAQQELNVLYGYRWCVVNFTQKEGHVIAWVSNKANETQALLLDVTTNK